jgi:5-oxoprolinase (ATP-hydrolysing)
MGENGRITISIDRGGTFTDVHAVVPGQPDIILKLLSVDPAHYQDAPTEGVRQILERVTGKPHPRGKPLELGPIESLRMGTTVATNALLERKGARSALLTTKGFRDLLRIGDQSRPNIFDLSMARPGVLPEAVVEIDERIVPCHPLSDKEAFSGARLVEGVTGEKFRVVKELDIEKVRPELERLKEKGYQSLSVALVHSYAYPEHERLIGEMAESMGFSVTLSSKLQPMIKIVPRGMSAAADAYLTPVIKTYIDSISSSFEGGLANQHTCRFEFMQSDGGLVDFRKFSGLKAILSGPAAGVVGFAATSWDPKEKIPVIGFDMGGTSTDVSRFDGHLEHVFGSKLAGVQIQSPQLDINTVAAGGGSILNWRNGLFYVGPESASAHPGPACYRKGGPLTVTDANLFLGRLLPEFFPHIFGENEDQPLDIEITTRLFNELTETVNKERKAKGQSEYSAEEVALGFLKVADESMARPIRNLTEARGFETGTHHLACFGGAGGQHACPVAGSLGISRIIIHKFSSVLSAYGLALAEVVKESQEPLSTQYTTSKEELNKRLGEMTEAATKDMAEQGFSADQVRHERYLNLRYDGSDTSLMILEPEDDSDFLEQFEIRHRREFGFNSDRPVLVDDIRVRTIAASKVRDEKSPLVQLREATIKDISTSPDLTTKTYFDGQKDRLDTPVYQLDKIEKNSRINGPAIIIDQTQTIVVVPDAVATVLETCIVIDLKEAKSTETEAASSGIDTIKLSIFGHRFMAIAEQMGRTLQRTSVSTNIKERLDFSCALFSPDGGLVANAPHVPVHLGSMQFAVRYQHQKWLNNLKDGDVLVANHPSCGGTHLPDITVSPILLAFLRLTDRLGDYPRLRQARRQRDYVLCRLSRSSCRHWWYSSRFHASQIYRAMAGRSGDRRRQDSQ